MEDIHIEGEFPSVSYIKYEKTMIEMYKNRTIDDRVKIEDTSVYPYSCIGPLLSKQEDGKFYIGTGTLIADRYVITAAHNPYENKFKSPEFYFAPSLNGGDLGKVEYSRGTELLVFNEYTENEKYPDIAVMKLEKPLGTTFGSMNLGIFDSKINSDLNFHGYPGDKYKEGKNKFTLWGSQVKAIEEGKRFITFTCDSYSGMSGSAVYERKKGEATIFGIFFAHSYSNNTEKYGVATLLTPNILKEIRDYMEQSDNK